MEGYYVKDKHFEGRAPYLIIDNYIKYDNYDGFIMYEVDPKTICQCTGLIDKNGNRKWFSDDVCVDL